ncbi:hypothetical protein BV497_01285 [Fulvimonas soli]|nr:hypothetical protein BV497_01285 [Fulvimonas soli]
MALAIAAVLACVAAPPMLSLAGRYRRQSAQSDLVAALGYAREAAVRRQRPVLVCPSRDGRQCSEDTRWEGGWLLGEDRDHDGQVDEALRVGQGYAGIVIRSTAGRRSVRFRPDGSAAGSNLTLLFCPAGSAQADSRVIVSNAGRIRTERTAESCL